jgi:hypothetical protein
VADGSRPSQSRSDWGARAHLPARTELRSASAPVNTVTSTPATNSAPPGTVLPVSGRCGSDTTFGHGHTTIVEPGETDTFLPGLPLDANGNFHAGLLIAPNEPLGTRTFLVDCYVEGADVSGTEGRSLFNVAGTPVNDFTITAQPATGSPGTHVTLHGTGCILNGIPLETAHLLVGVENPARAESFDLRADVGPDGTWTKSFSAPPPPRQAWRDVSTKESELNALLGARSHAFAQRRRSPKNGSQAISVSCGSDGTATPTDKSSNSPHNH